MSRVRNGSNMKILNDIRNSVQKYATQLKETEAIVAIYPTWWYGLPAMLKGYFDRVWAPGIAFDIGADGKFETDRLSHIKEAWRHDHLRLALVVDPASTWSDPERKLWGRAIREVVWQRLHARLACPLQHG